jgi:hypothetical protein
MITFRRRRRNRGLRGLNGLEAYLPGEPLHLLFILSGAKNLWRLYSEFVLAEKSEMFRFAQHDSLFKTSEVTCNLR